MEKMNKNPFTFDLTPLYDIADEIVQNYRDEIIAIDAIASKNLLNSINFEIVQKDDNTLTLQLIVLDYYYFIEFGRNKTNKLQTKWEASIDDISKWVSKKIQRGKFIPKNNRPIPTTDKEIEKVAYAIVNKIHRVGFYGDTHYGKHPLENSLKKSIADGLIDKFVNVFVEQCQNDVVADISGLTQKLQKRPN